MAGLRADRDACGHEIYDAYCGKGGYEIIEREDGFTAVSTGPAAYFSEYADWLPHSRQAIASLRRARLLLKHFYPMTSPDARLIVESLDPYKTTEPWHLRYQKHNRRRGRMPGQIRIRVRYKGWISAWFDYLLVSQDEMRSIVDGTGWRVSRFYNSPKRPGYAALIEKHP